MRIQPAKALEKDLYEKVRTSLAKEARTGIHASDLTSPRKSYWQRVFSNPSEDEIGYWLTGRGHHYYLVSAVSGVEGTDEGSREYKLTDTITLLYSPDLASIHGEFKTSRKPTIPPDETAAIYGFASYIPQCKTYAVAEGVNFWHLYVLFITPLDEGGLKLGPRLKVYTLTFTDAELAEHKQFMIDRAMEFDVALKTNDPSALPLCAEWQCFSYGIDKTLPKIKNPDTNRMIFQRSVKPKCQYWDKCRPSGRWSDVDAASLQ